MSNVTKIEENVRRMTRKREFDETKRTDRCLTVTCPKRMKWMKEHGTEIPLDECVGCYYHPDYKSEAKRSRSSDVRTRSKKGLYRALESSFQATQENRREEGNYADPSPF